MVISQKKQTNKYTEKLVILQLIGIIVIKSKETRMTYTCRYASGHLISIIQSCQDELRIKCPLEYLQVKVIILVFLLFITMIPIDCKITNFSIYLSSWLPCSIDKVNPDVPENNPLYYLFSPINDSR